MWKLVQFSHNCTGQGGRHVKDPRHPEGKNISQATMYKTNGLKTYVSPEMYAQADKGIVCLVTDWRITADP